jgi:ankyrin repeat protein
MNTSKDVKVFALVLLLATPIALASAINNASLIDAVKSHNLRLIQSLLSRHIDVNRPQADGSTALMWAAYQDDVATAKALIRSGANVNATNALGAKPLSIACLNGSSAMVAALLKAGARANTALPSGETALMTAARAGSVDCVKLLLSHGAQVNAYEARRGQTALMWAVAENHTEVVRSLIEHGADVHAKSKSGFTPLLFAAQQGNLDIANILLAAGADVNEATPEYGNTLVVATASGFESLARFFLEKGADPNAADVCGITALHYALMLGLARVGGVGNQQLTPGWYRPNMHALAKDLLNRGANPNARIKKFPLLPATRKISAISLVGATPFLLAAASYDVEMMRLLAAHKADPRLATSENTTPLMVAAGLSEGLNYSLTLPDQGKILEAVKLLIAMGADVNAASDIGETALHGAAYVGADKVVQLLVEKGANVNAENKYGQTPLSIADQTTTPRLTDRFLRPYAAHQSTAELLRKLGAVSIDNAQLKIPEAKSPGLAQ